MVNWFGRILFFCALSAAIGGCVTGITDVNHGIQYDMRYDNQDAEVLDLKYRSGSKVIYGVPDEYVRMGTAYGADGAFGPMQRGTSVYVKWRNKKTGEVYDDTVDLRQRLPADIRNKTIYIMIWGAQLNLFLVSDERRPEGEPAIGPAMERANKVQQIYPDHKQ